MWLTVVVVKESSIHWFEGLTRNVEVLWRTTNELRVGVLVMDRGGSDVTLHLCSCAILETKCHLAER